MATDTTKKIINRSASLDSSWSASYRGAFSSSNIYASIIFPYNSTPIALGSIAAISISTHRDSFPVTNMYNVNPVGITQGHRMIAGTLIFHTIDKNAFYYEGNTTNSRVYREAISGIDHVGYPHPDTFPLFDIHITYINEEGMLSFEAVYGVRLLDFGKTMSFENLHPMESYSFMALEYAPMRKIEKERRDDTKKLLLSKPTTREPVPLLKMGPPIPIPGNFDPGVSDHDLFTG